VKESLVPLDRIGQIAIRVHDVDRAVAFYRDVMGVPHLFSVPGMAFFDCGGVRLMLSLPTEPRFDHNSSILYFKVNDIHAEAARLRDAGVRFEREPFLVAPMPAYDLWMAFFVDSEENVMALMAELPKAGG
jgi:methylmalonyl-CoA/ethylmalonyl-CoA epimerase